MMPAHRHISILAYALLCACSGALTSPRQMNDERSDFCALTVDTIQGELSSTQERENQMEHIIEVRLSATNELVTAPEDNPRKEVARGDIIIWRFAEKAAKQELHVVVRDSTLFEGGLVQSEGQPDEISGKVSQVVQEDSIFKYEITKDGEELPWENRPDGGELVIRNPPNRPPSQRR